MAGFDSDISFIPAVSQKFDAGNVIVVKYALGGQPIRRWQKDWSLREGDDPKQIGDL